MTGAPTPDHLFVLVDDLDAAEAEALAAGLVVSHRRTHEGQGTRNVCFSVGDHGFYLEFLAIHDRSALTAPAVLPTGLAGRFEARTQGACPIGVGLRGGSTRFSSWRYTVPFPPGMAADLSVHAEQLGTPLVFRLTDGRPPLPPPGIELAGPQLGLVRDDLRALTAAGVHLVPADVHHVRLTWPEGPEEQVTLSCAPVTLRRSAPRAAPRPSPPGHPAAPRPASSNAMLAAGILGAAGLTGLTVVVFALVAVVLLCAGMIALWFLIVFAFGLFSAVGNGAAW